jgi:hypothetical protein
MSCRASRWICCAGRSRSPRVLGSDAPPLLLKAAKRLESFDLELARETYLGTWGAALFAGRLAGTGDLLEVSRAARALPAHPRRPVDLLLDGLALLTTDGAAAAAPALRQAAGAFARSEASIAEGLRWGWIAYGAASTMWDDDLWRAILLRQVGLARRVGALDHLPILLGALTMAAVWRGDFAGAAELIMEADAATEATGSQIAPYAAMLLASLQGHQDEAVPLIEATIAVAPARGRGPRRPMRTGWLRSSATASAATRRHSRRPGKPAKTGICTFPHGFCPS